jgi:fructokinase
MKNKVLAFGEALWDLLPDGAVLGGAPLNFAYRLNSLGTETKPVSCLGRDQLGQKAMDKIQTLGVTCDCIFMTSEKPTGQVHVQFDESGQPFYTIQEDVAYDIIPFHEKVKIVVSKATVICFGTLAQRQVVSRDTLTSMLDMAQEALIIFDINLRQRHYTKEIIISSLQRANICKLNDEELVYLDSLLDLKCESLTTAACHIIRLFNLDLVIVTLGAKGAMAVTNTEESFIEEGYSAKTGGDPCGAGDAFTAGFIHLYLQNKNIRKALRFGNAMGALVAGQKGATVPITREAAEIFVSQGFRNHLNEEDLLIQ